MEDLKTLTQYGYWFRRLESPDKLGAGQLRVVIREEPTEQHFDPEMVIFPVIFEKTWQHMVVEHPWHLQHRRRAIIGIIEIVDRMGNKKQALTFGGVIMIESHQEYTEVVFDSPAPIIELGDEKSARQGLAEEVRVLMAKRRAAYKLSDYVFFDRLDRASSIDLYAGCVFSLIERLKKYAPNTDTCQELMRLLQLERDRMKEERLYSHHITGIEDIV